MIASGTMDIVIASGCEIMTKYTMFSDMNGTLYTGQPMGNPFGKWYTGKYGRPDQIAAAQMIADKWEITLEECQDFAIASHQKAHKATQEGRFKNEIMPMKGVDKEGNEITRDTDETIRPETTPRVAQHPEGPAQHQMDHGGHFEHHHRRLFRVVLMSEKK